jgi:hypothetical protein
MSHVGDARSDRMREELSNALLATQLLRLPSRDRGRDARRLEILERSVSKLRRMVGEVPDPAWIGLIPYRPAGTGRRG